MIQQNSHPLKTPKLHSVWLLIFSLSLFACNTFQSKNDDLSPVVAQVGKAKLTEKNLEAFIGDNFSAEDSVRLINAYINRWVREELMVKEAEKSLINEADILRMVEEYRKSLLIHKFEEDLIRTKLDSNISEKTIAEQYQKNKASFILSEPIYRVRWIRITNTNIPPEELKTHWSDNKVKTEEKWIKLSELYANNYNLDPNIWWTKTELLRLLPGDNDQLLSDDKKVTLHSLNENGTLLFDLIEEKEQGELAPIPFVKDDIKSYILHQRKEAFLKKFREDLYKKAVNSNTVKINLK